MMNPQIKVPSHPDAERAVLGALLLDPEQARKRLRELHTGTLSRQRNLLPVGGPTSSVSWGKERAVWRCTQPPHGYGMFAQA